MKLATSSAAVVGIIACFLGSIAEAATAVSAVRETQKIRPTDPAPAAQSDISLSCAKNEFCAFQVAVSADASGPVTVTDVSLGDLTGPCASTLAAASSSMVYREGFLDVTTPSNSAGLTGQWPDPLIPKVDAFYGETRNAFPAQIAAGQTQGFWIELLIPSDQAPGMYSGSATVTPSSGSPVVITVAIQVRDFTLPSTSSLGSAYGFDWDGPCVGHYGGYGAPDCDDQQLEALNALYFEDALNHRLSISALVYAPPITNGQGDFTTFDTLYGPFLNGTVLSGKDQLQGAKLTAIAYTGDQVSASYAAWASHFKTMGWFDRVFDYTCDEPPNGCAWSDIPTRAAIVHGGDPQFRTLTTTSVQEAQANDVLSYLDILVPIINYMDGTPDDPYPGDQRANYDTFLQMPNTLLWMYQSCEPSSSCSNGSVGGNAGWPTMFIDEPAISNRMMQWMDFKYQVTAELYYDTTYAMSSSTQNAWQTQYEFGNNGDGSIWYPGKPSVIGGAHDIPVESLRMKMLREGMQDYEYLNLLTTLGDGAFAQTELGKVVTSAGNFTSDPEVLDQARIDMATEIEADLAKTDGGGGSVTGGCDGGGGTEAGGATDASGAADAIGAADSSGGNDDGGGAVGGPGGSLDGGPGRVSSKAGCGCRVGAPVTSAPVGFALMAIVGAWARRRKRGHTRCSSSPQAM
jgi:MYXO-CTERM domain-containing protein